MYAAVEFTLWLASIALGLYIVDKMTSIASNFIANKRLDNIEERMEQFNDHAIATDFEFDEWKNEVSDRIDDNHDQVVKILENLSVGMAIIADGPVEVPEQNGEEHFENYAEKNGAIVLGTDTDSPVVTTIK